MVEDLYAISLWQPWASLLFTSVKVHETRHWRAPQRVIGKRIIVHAAKTRRGFDNSIDDLCYEEWGCGYNHSLPFGVAIGTAILDGCEPTDTHAPAHEDDARAGDWSPGRFAWRLKEAREFREPVPMVGRQRFWKPTESLTAALYNAKPWRGQFHWHVCSACLRSWGHTAGDASASHLCPKCGAGPFTSGDTSLQTAFAEAKKLKTLAVSPTPEQEEG